MEQVFYERALMWIVLLPLAGAIINGLAGRFAHKKLVGAVAVGTVALAFVLAVLAFVHLVGMKGGDDGARLTHHVYEWLSLGFPRGDVPVNVSFVMDSLSGVMTLVVTGIGLLIHIYSLEYMEDDPGFARFFTYLNLFTASMLLLVLASNMPLMFVGWEGVGLCSYLLIGFWWENPAYAAAGKKAFIYNRVGDFGVLIGMFLLVTTIGSFELADINANAREALQPFVLGRWEVASVATVACLFLFLGCTGKSAQIPLFVWLPDAMAGPTPVSALIHAATMVTAGVYLCARLSSLFILSPTAMAVIAIVGALTALLAASIALVQNEIKKILAYSTVSQLGFMFAAVGAGAFAAGIFHVFTHAFFKACLFLGAGAVMHAVHAHGDADIRKLGGLRKHLPTVHWTFLVSCLAIAGVPLFSGFFSKDEILYGALLSTGYFESAWIGWFLFAVLALAATMTAFYMFRLYFLTFTGSYRSAGEEGASHGDGHGYAPHPHRPHGRIAWPLIVLGTGAVVVGYLGLPHALHLPNVWGHWLETTLAALPPAKRELPEWLPWAAMAGGTLAMLVGIGLAWTRYKDKTPEIDEAFAGTSFGRLLMDKWRVDELYELLVIRPSRWMARFAGYIDKYFVDFLLTRATAMGVQVSGWLFTRLQSGLVFAYGVVMVAGLVVLAWWFMYPHPEVEGAVQDGGVRWVAARGLGYEYRWDVNGDGRFDVEEWTDQHDVTTRYEEQDYVGYALVVETPPRGQEVLRLDPEGRTRVIPEHLLGRGWETDAEGNRRPPAASVDPESGKVVLRANDAHVRAPAGAADEDGVLRLSAGDTVQVGAAFMRVAPVARATVEVRNAFGNVRPATEEIVLDPRVGGERQAMLIGGDR